jgi:hypothetical protein
MTPRSDCFYKNYLNSSLADNRDLYNYSKIYRMLLKEILKYKIKIKLIGLIWLITLIYRQLEKEDATDLTLVSRLGRSQ